MRAILALSAALLALAPAAWASRVREPDTIVAQPLSLDAQDRSRRRVGALTYLGGWVLHARDRRFGGFSALAVDGDRLLLLSDAGWALRLKVTGRQVSSDGWHDIGERGGKAARDSESLTHDPAMGQWWIGFEGQNAIARWSARFARQEGAARPAAMQGWPANGGAESLARLPDGRFVMIAETATRPDGAREALLFGGDPVAPGAMPLRFGYRPPDGGYDPSDAAALPDGRLLVLNRRFSLTHGIGAALTLVDLRGVTAGAVVSGRLLASFAAPLAVDNMEGVAVGRESGRTIVWLMSDDNFLPFQRTLLMKFVLDPPL